jgi:hypothetical protein
MADRFEHERDSDVAPTGVRSEASLAALLGMCLRLLGFLPSGSGSKTDLHQAKLHCFGALVLPRTSGPISRQQFEGEARVRRAFPYRARGFTAPLRLSRRGARGTRGTLAWLGPAQLG